MANFKHFNNGRKIFDTIHGWSSEFPLMVMEFWTGWFDYWGSSHSQQSVDGKSLRVVQLQLSFVIYITWKQDRLISSPTIFLFMYFFVIHY